MGDRLRALGLLFLGLTLLLTLPDGATLRAEGTAPIPLPLRQSVLDRSSAPLPVTLRDASRDDRWLGLGVRDVRWSPDGRFVYFRWNERPTPADDPVSDPWFRVDRDGRGALRVPDADIARLPAETVSWGPRGERAAWATGGRVYVWEAASGVRLVWSGSSPGEHVRLSVDGRFVHFMQGEDLYEQDLKTRSLRRLTARFERKPEPSEAARWLELQQRQIFDTLREQERIEKQAQVRDRRWSDAPAQEIPVEAGQTIESVQLSPARDLVTFLARTANKKRPPTRYMDYATRSGYAEAPEARPKVGEPQDELRKGIERFTPETRPEDVVVTWASFPAAGERPTVVHGPYWSLDGSAALVQVVTADCKDRWIARLDLASGVAVPIAHDHDDAWLGGPPPLGNDLGPTLLEWLPGARFVFASERSGWSHLYLAEPDGAIRSLTSGAWEVRAAALSRDRSRWLIGASREHPSDDHLYLMPATGGELTRLTTDEGRHQGALSPDGTRLAAVSSDNVRLPDLWLRDARREGPALRVTQSGTDEYQRRRLVRPEIVSFPHPDGRPVWAALYRPTDEKRNAAAVLHIHGGGYRQFSHRGWSVYGWGLHLGLVHALVEYGYVVLDFDYRGGAGFGRDYRTDIYRSMGDKDVSGAVAAVDSLVREHGVERSRVGLYGLSYGGFFTLMALFKHPGVFAAGVANAPVTDWAHYEHAWTSRILGVPFLDPEAYARSSPISFASGLADPLLLVHGLIDDNVHFQDTARLAQRLIELEKDFEVAYYPLERHVIESEASRYDYVRRVSAFFARHLAKR